MAISGTKGQGWRAIPTQYRKARDILTSTLAVFLFSSHTKRERDRQRYSLTSKPQRKTYTPFGKHAERAKSSAPYSEIETIKKL